MTKVGFVGWRGMVGSVLLERMLAEQDFGSFEPIFFSTSQAGGQGPDIGAEVARLADAYDLSLLKEMDIVVSCQGGDYTKRVHGSLRSGGWEGYWIDAASTLRMENDSVIILDPVNRDVIDHALENGVKDYIGGNCTVSLMLMGVGGLLKAGLVEWISSMTYQAASGAGAQNMKELVRQMQVIGSAAGTLAENPASAVLDLDRTVLESMFQDSFPREHFGAPLAGSLLPWIDRPVENGQSREEWKGMAETNKIMKLQPEIPVDGICVRIGAMRCHAQALTIKLNREVPLNDVSRIIAEANDWVELIPNTKEDSIKRLTPAAVSGTLRVPVGRLRRMNFGPEYLSAFTVGDQLLWGAAEPLRRMLKILLAGGS